MSATGETGSDDQWVENSAPTTRWPKLDISQPWIHRELIFFFALRDVKVRYKQAFLGVAWAGLQPLAGALAFTLVFNGLAGLEVEDSSYFVFALSGFIVWAYFTSAVNTGTSSLLFNADLISKVALPRITLPVAALLPPLIDLTVGAALALVITFVWGDGASISALAIGLPLGAALLVMTALGPVLFLSSCIVKYRDVGVIAGFGLQLFLFLSPVAYPPTLVTGAWATLQYLNPVAGALSLFRWAFGGGELPATGLLLMSAASALAILVPSLVYFRAREQELVDIV